MKDRLEFSYDVMQGVSGLFGGGKGKNPLQKHIDELQLKIEELHGG